MVGTQGNRRAERVVERCQTENILVPGNVVQSKSAARHTSKHRFQHGIGKVRWKIGIRTKAFGEVLHWKMVDVIHFLVCRMPSRTPTHRQFTLSPPCVLNGEMVGRHFTPNNKKSLIIQEAVFTFRGIYRVALLMAANSGASNFHYTHTYIHIHEQHFIVFASIQFVCYGLFGFWLFWKCSRWW